MGNPARESGVLLFTPDRFLKTCQVFVIIVSCIIYTYKVLKTLQVYFRMLSSHTVIASGGTERGNLVTVNYL
jgi:hypothetical protein